MNAVRALSWQLVAALPVQRGCFYLAVLLLGGALVAGVRAGAALDGQGALLAATFGIVLLFLACAPVGLLAQLWLQTRLANGLPAFRCRMLAALLVNVCLPGALAAVVIAVSGATVSPWVVLILVTAAFSGLLAVVHFAPRSFVAVLVLIAGLQLIDENGFEAWLLGSGAVVAAVALVSGWALFGVWFIRGGVVARFDLDQWMRGSRSEPIAVAGSITPRRAVPLMLCRAEPPRAAQVAAPFIGTLAAVWLLLSVVDIADVVLASAVIGTVVAFPAAREVARRSRLLWLRFDASRAELFRCVERVLVRTLMPVPLALFVAVNFACVLAGAMPWSAFGPGVAAITAGAVAGGYAGLMVTGRFGTVGLLIAAAWLATVGGVVVNLLLGEYARLAVLIAVQIVLSLAARAIAARRWRSIDWLQFGPATSVRRSG